MPRQSTEGAHTFTRRVKGMVNEVASAIPDANDILEWMDAHHDSSEHLAVFGGGATTKSERRPG